MSLDLGNAPEAPAPSPSEKAQMRSALGIVETNVRYDSSQGLSAPQKAQAVANIDAVPISRTINGSSLSGNIMLTASDVGAATAAQGIDERVPTVVGLTSKFGTVKTPIIDNDRVAIFDSATSNAPKHTLWSSLKATLKTYFDGFYSATNHSHFSAAISDASSVGGCGDSGKVVIYGANGSIVTHCDSANIIASGYVGGQYLKISSGGRASCTTSSDCNGITWSANQSGTGGNNLTREIVIDSTPNRFDLSAQRVINDIIVTSGDNYNNWDILLAGTTTPSTSGQLALIASSENTETFWNVANKPRWSSDGAVAIPVSGSWLRLSAYYLKNPTAGTVDSLFPKASYTHTTDPNTASRITVYPTLDGGLNSYWLFTNGGNPFWRKSGFGNADYGSDVIGVGHYILPQAKFGREIGDFHAAPMNAVAADPNAEFYYVLLKYVDGVAVGYWAGVGTDPMDADLVPIALATGTPVASKAAGSSGEAATAAQVIALVNSSSLGVTLANSGECNGTAPVVVEAEDSFSGGSLGFLTTVSALATVDREQLQPDADGVYALTESTTGIPDKLHNGTITGNLDIESSVVNLTPTSKTAIRSALGPPVENGGNLDQHVYQLYFDAGTFEAVRDWYVCWRNGIFVGRFNNIGDVPPHTGTLDASEYTFIGGEAPPP